MAMTCRRPLAACVLQFALWFLHQTMRVHVRQMANFWQDCRASIQRQADHFLCDIKAQHSAGLREVAKHTTFVVPSCMAARDLSTVRRWAPACIT